MKIGSTGRAAVAASAYGARAAAAQPLAAIAPAPGASASVLGIPEAEFTPHVRQAVMGLMGEVEELRREIEETRKRLEEAARAADQDTLLPILNRRAFVREMSRFIAFAERYGTPSSIVYFDLDDFKRTNDTHGHAAGDEVLRHFAQTISGQVRDTDIVGRLGGDEFGVILAHTDARQAAQKAAAMARVLQSCPASWDNRSLEVAFSFGAYELHAGEKPAEAMARADEAMYAQKRLLKSGAR